MRKIASTNLHDYWLIDTNEPTNRMAYVFYVVGNDGIEMQNFILVKTVKSYR